MTHFVISDERKEVKFLWRFKFKKFMGKEYMGIIRTTFVIDENG